MEVQTLDDLKQENADEAAQQVKENVALEAEAETETDDDAIQDSTTQDEPEAETEVTEEKPSWLSEDSDSQDTERLFTGSDIAAAKRKLKGKLEQSNSEVEELKAQMAQMQQQMQPQQPQAQALNRPTREQFINSDDPDEAYIDALTDWKLTSKIQQSQGVVQRSGSQ